MALKFLRPAMVLLLSGSICQGCYTFHMGNGHAYRQAFPSKDRASLQDIDTSRFVYRSFHYADLVDNTSAINGRRLVESVTGADARELVSKGGRYYLYFWDPGCPAFIPRIHFMDSLARTGEKVLMLAVQRNVEVIERKLSKTSFAQSPIYVIAGASPVILQRHIDFIRDACGSCYEAHKDGLMNVDYLLLENKKLKTVMANDPANVMRR